MGPKKDLKKQVAEPPPQEQPPPLPLHELQGYGRFEYLDGTVYEGHWKLFQGVKKKHGQGVLKISNGNNNFGAEIYQGAWEEDEMGGYGIYKYANGATYKGEWKKNKHHGRGEYEFPNGTCYEGDWQNHLMHGSGYYVDSSGKKWDGQFRNGRFQSKLQKQLANERQLIVRKAQIIKDIQNVINEMLEALAKSDKKTLKENFSPFFPSGEIIKEQVKDPYSKFDQRPPEKWTQSLALLKSGTINPLANPSEAIFLSEQRILKPQLEGAGQVVEVTLIKEERSIKSAFVNVEGKTWILCSFADEEKKK